MRITSDVFKCKWNNVINQITFQAEIHVQNSDKTWSRRELASRISRMCRKVTENMEIFHGQKPPKRDQRKARSGLGIKNRDGICHAVCRMETKYCYTSLYVTVRHAAPGHVIRQAYVVNDNTMHTTRWTI